MRALRLAVFEGRVADLKRLCRGTGVNINEAGPKTRRTALHWGALGGHSDTISYLLKTVRADIDPLDIDANTPLNLLIQASELALTKKLAIIDLLLAHQANPTIANHEGKTPLMCLRALHDALPDSHYMQRTAIAERINRIEAKLSNASPLGAPQTMANLTQLIAPERIIPACC